MPLDVSLFLSYTSFVMSSEIRLMDLNVRWHIPLYTSGERVEGGCG